MTNSTWNETLGTANYDDPTNWTLGVPGAGDTAFFIRSDNTTILIPHVAQVGGWDFSPSVSDYAITISNVEFDFIGDGIGGNGGRANIDNFGILLFRNGSTAGSATITTELNTALDFYDASSAGSASINSYSDFLDFTSSASAADATIHTLSGARTRFFDFANGGNAELNTDALGTVDFSHSSGPTGNHQLTVGSIAGAGTYDLGANQLTVGSNGQSAIVSGLISGAGGSLVKLGDDSLTLSGAYNTYSGGTTIEHGTLDIAAVGAAGTGDITFAGRATLKVENAGLSGHRFGNPVDFFGRPDVLDLTGLHFHAGASATYHRADHLLSVRSGSITDTLTLFSPHGLSFTAASDRHGGTEVRLDPSVTSSARHHFIEHAIADLAVGGGSTAAHHGDYLFAA
jgi:autotransporter-associated beta strand protein